MVTYQRSKEDERRIVRCAACDGTVLTEIAGFGRIDANTACASCGTTLVDSPFSGSDYYDVIMRVGRFRWRGARLRRAG
jgi:ribosomal protein S27E